MALKAFVGALILLCSLQHGLTYGPCDVLLNRGKGTFVWEYGKVCNQMIYTIPGSEYYDLTIKLTESSCSAGRVQSSIRPTGSPTFQTNYSSTALKGTVFYSRPGYDVQIILHDDYRGYCRPNWNVTGVYSQVHNPGNWTAVKLQDSDYEECANGGHRLQSTDSHCVCPPGFSGPKCVDACGGDKYGDSCKQSCSGDKNAKGDGCRGFKFCYFDACACAAGFQGPNCDTGCEVGRYGSNCTQQCGMCINGGNCDPVTGHCASECQPGYLRPYCRKKLTHLQDAPIIHRTGVTFLKGYFPVGGIRGEGSIVFYQPQHKVKSDPDSKWISSSLGRYSTTSDSISFTIDNLPPDTDVIVRVLLLDDKMRAYDSPPSVSARTLGRSRVENLAVYNVSARSAFLTWDSYNFKQGEYFFVRRECVSLLACSGPCPHTETVLVAASTSLALDELLPGATYRVTVQSTENHQQVAVFTTNLLPPDTTVSLLRVSARTNNSAMLEWQPSAQCDLMFGPTTLYEWRLKSIGGPNKTISTNTTATATMLTGLEALSEYQFSVNLYNTEGSAHRTATLNFSTYHTVPDPPRDLIAYRQNRSAIWLRWREPSRPSGALREYVVEVTMLKGTSLPAGKAARAERLPASTRCAAWPDQVCFAVTRLRPQARYAVTVRAVNEHGTKPGEPSSIEATTIKGVSEPPQDLRTDEILSDSALISWRLPEKINGDLQVFEVSVVRHVRPDEPSGETDVPDPDLELMFESKEKPRYERRVKGLQPGATYSITVNCGHGGQPAHLEVTTSLSVTKSPAMDADDDVFVDLDADGIPDY